MVIRCISFLSVLLLGIACNQVKEEKSESVKEADSRPNILLIVADDLGFSDIGPYGGNINTPVLDQLSKQSVLFSNFHVLPTCSPTRSALLTGNDNHMAGLGVMSETDYPALHALALPGYSGALSKQVVTIPEILKENNYHTYMVGKWHLGDEPDQNPYNRGFEQTFILGTGGGSHFNDRRALAPPQKMEYSRNGMFVEPPADFYSSRDYTDSLIQFLERDKADEKPFFAFLSYTAVHDPLHAPKEYIDKYKGKFDKGWDSLWAERFKNLQALGIVPTGIKTVPNPAVTKWEKLSAEHKAEYARDMEVYAAMLEYMDMSIGRVLDYLKKSDKYDNTMIIFMSDNGANGAIATAYPGNEDGKYLRTFNNAMDNRGLKGSFVEMGPGWAWASSAPFRYFKSFTTEGGIRAPLIVKMPGDKTGGGQWNHNFTHVTDIMPTLLEITNSSYPQTYKSNAIHPLIGKSLTATLKDPKADVHGEDGIGYELFEMKAYIKGKWKILRLPVPLGSGDWELYDLSADPGEATDLSSKFPEIREQLIKAWANYAIQNSVHDHKGHFDSIYRRKYQ
jgi:arylsulfatase A-like enzyme